METENVININLSKKLSDLGLLECFDTKYFYLNQYNRLMSGKSSEYLDKHKSTLTKTLTFEECFYFIGKQMCQIQLLYPNSGKWTLQTVLDGPEFNGSLIEVFEQFIEYLVDNKLITK